MFSGPFAIIFYAVEIFQEAGSGVDQYLAAIITAIVRIIGGPVALILIQKLPRIKHIMLTMTIMGISMISLGVILYFKDDLGDSSAITLIPILCVSLYLFAFGAGKKILIQNLKFQPSIKQEIERRNFVFSVVHY